MRGVRVCVGVLSIVAGGCAAGSHAADDDSASEVDAGEDAALSTHEASTGPNAHDALANGDAWGGGEGASPDANDDASTPLDASPPGNDDAQIDANDDASAPPVDASDDSPGSTNIAPTGVGYTWQSMTSATANTGRLTAPVVNDNSLSTQANIDSSTGDDTNAWEAAGVIFASAQSVSAVTFVQGATGSASAGDGWFEASFALQLSTDGSSWSTSAWSASPPYAYSSAVSGKAYVFSGTPVTGIVGVRVVGQVNTAGKSWWAAAKEVMVFPP